MISSIFSGYNTMRLEINYKKKKIQKTKNTWRLNNMLLNNQWVTEEIKRKSKNTWRQMKTKTHMIQYLWDAAKAVLRGKCIAIQAYLRKQTNNSKLVEENK